MTKRKSVEEFNAVRDKLVTEDKLAECVDFIWNHALEYNISDHQRYIDTAILAYKNKDSQKALDILLEGFYEKEYWFHPIALRRDNFPSLFDTEVFQKLYQDNIERRSALINNQQVSSFDHTPQHPKKLLVVLSGNYFWPTKQTIKEDMESFQDQLTILGDEYALLVGVSCEAGPTGMPIWFDAKKNAIHITKEIEAYHKKLHLSWKDTIMMAYSAGGNVLLTGITMNLMKPSKVALMYPACKEVMEDNYDISSIIEHHISLRIYVGEHDFCLPYATRISTLLSDKNYEDYQ